VSCSQTRTLAILGEVSTRALSLALILAVASGCAADAVTEPEPTLDTKGAFFAVANDDSDYRLFRTLAVIGSGNTDDVLFVVPYTAKPKTFAEAARLAKDPALAHADTIAIGKRYVFARDWRVVWFRSVSPEEEAGFR
jgi:hypothetical protein